MEVGRGACGVCCLGKGLGAAGGKGTPVIKGGVGVLGGVRCRSGARTIVVTAAPCRRGAAKLGRRTKTPKPSPLTLCPPAFNPDRGGLVP